ncbi:MAG: MAPEG family protein [Nakamurella sp.]
MTIAVSCVALLGLLLFSLGLRVSVLRGKQRVLFGSTNNPADPLFRAVRAHGNAAEYIPTLAVLMLLVSARVATWWPALLCLLALTFRVIHAVALTRPPRRTMAAPDRYIGALGTYAVGIALAITALASL